MFGGGSLVSPASIDYNAKSVKGVGAESICLSISVFQTVNIIVDSLTATYFPVITVAVFQTNNETRGSSH